MTAVISHIKNFIFPNELPVSDFDGREVSVCAILPTYKPNITTKRLVRDLLRWNPNIELYVVDDCTPRGYRESTRIFDKITSISSRVNILRTPVNTLKAGALNYALRHIYEARKQAVPEIILTLDDDVIITQTTVKNLVAELMGSDALGAVCVQCNVCNKNKNLLTRLQGLEYTTFNAVRFADDGFLQGPLVMPGMLTAFRTAALREAGFFMEGHLIEDYEMTTRLKTLGWRVCSAPTAYAGTMVPERLSTLWRQRTRWSYGGVTVVTKAQKPLCVLQDMLGHGVFISMLLLIIFLIVVKGEGEVSPYITNTIISLSLLQLGVWYVFQLWLMRFYREKDRYDWLLRIGIVPELIYNYLTTLVLLGSYLFYSFSLIKRAVGKRPNAFLQWLVDRGNNLFRVCGYTERWGTRVSGKIC